MPRKRIVIASDSFKGTLSSLRICQLFRQEIKNKDIEGIYLSIADGGEGSLETIANVIKGRYIDIKVKDLYFKEINTRFYVDKKNNAYIETASCAGLTLAHKDNNPGLVTTYGLGEQMLKAKEMGCKNIYVFLGASATNDGGVGLASAIGTKFFNKDNKEFIPRGLTLKDIVRIERSILLDDLNIYALADVSSPLCGLEGASYKFGPQKGADPHTVKLLDDGLHHLSDIIKRDLGIDILEMPGSGAAGGLGGGLVAFCRGKITSGIKTILDLIDFDDVISNADLVISGEGKLDKQTYDGKVIDGIAKRCMKMNKPLDIIVGISEISLEDMKKSYPCVKHIYETNEKHLPFEEIKEQAEEAYITQIRRLLDNLLD